MHKYGDSKSEVEAVLARPGEDRPGTDGSRVAVGQTSAGGRAVAEDEAALEQEDPTLMEVPSTLVPAVRGLIAKRRNGATSLLDTAGKLMPSARHAEVEPM